MNRLPESITLRAMKCLDCGQEIPDEFFTAWEQSPQAKSGRFTCPHCRADHVRRDIGKTPEGKPLFSIRLWGHPTSTRRKKPEAGP